MHYKDRIFVLDLLTILHELTDEEHYMTQDEIVKELEDKYGYPSSPNRRRTVKRNIEKLISYGEYTGAYEIGYDINTRKMKNKETGATEEVEFYSNFNYLHDFTHEELYLIIDSLLFSRHIPGHQRKDLIRKLEKLTSDHFNSRQNHVYVSSQGELVNKSLFNNIKCLDQAISESKQVIFHYNDYVIDEKSQLQLQARLNSEGQVREYVINPYQMVATNGRYYVICNNDEFDDMSHYRIDRITAIEILDIDRKPIKEVEGYERGLDLSQHMAEHIYMFAGQSINVELSIKRNAFGEFIDWFGTSNLNITKQTEDEILVRVKVNDQAMRKWALQYALHAKVISPPEFVAKVKADIQQAMDNYE